MSKKTTDSTGTTAKAKATPTPKKPEFPVSAKELPKLLSDEDKSLPDGVTMKAIQRVVTIVFTDELPFVLNTLNKYTDELRAAFQKASMPGWKAIFMANGKRYVSTL